MITIGTLKASVTLHQEMLERIVSSTMAFFDTTPVGRIINRFSKDMDEVDLMIPTHIKDILSDLFSVLGTLFVVCYATPIIIAAVIPLVLIFFFIQSSYLATSRQLKRMINVTRSPINSSLTESFSGAPTIRYLISEQQASKCLDLLFRSISSFFYFLKVEWTFEQVEPILLNYEEV